MSILVELVGSGGACGQGSCGVRAPRVVFRFGVTRFEKVDERTSAAVAATYFARTEVFNRVEPFRRDKERKPWVERNSSNTEIFPAQSKPDFAPRARCAEPSLELRRSADTLRLHCSCSCSCRYTPRLSPNPRVMRSSQTSRRERKRATRFEPSTFPEGSHRTKPWTQRCELRLRYEAPGRRSARAAAAPSGSSPRGGRPAPAPARRPAAPRPPGPR